MYKRFILLVKAVFAVCLMAQSVFAVSQRVMHTPSHELLDSVEKSRDELSDKYASTVVDAGSFPVEFGGHVQLITDLYRYGDLADSSYLMYDRQNLLVGHGNHLLNLEMRVNPGRNVDFWATMGVYAAYRGFSLFESDPAYRPGHHYEGEGVSVDEDLSAGIAIRTQLASFMLQAGAINWIEASPLSVWKGQPRVFAWERMPYEIEQPISQFYEYNIAHGYREGRAAWNKKPFQGIHLQSENLPGDFGLDFFYGVGSPIDKALRSHVGASNELEYQADYSELAGTGYGDSYTKQLFYRIHRNMLVGEQNNQLRIGVGNGYTLISDDILYAEEHSYRHNSHRYLLNRLYQFGMMNSLWRDSEGNEHTPRDMGLEATQDGDGRFFSAEPVHFGYGQWMEPRFFNLDVAGTAGDRIRWEMDLGFSYIDTNRVYVDPHIDGWSDLSLTNRTNWLLGQRVDGMDDRIEQMPIHTAETETLRSDVAAALYGQFQYGNDNTPWNFTVEGIYAGEGYNAPYSFVASHDYFYPLGSNMLGAQTFVNGTSASPYSQNTAGGMLTVEPELPHWYGHLRMKYGYTQQLSDMRDIIFFPYRLNGAELNASMESSYSRYGTGEMTQPIGGASREYQARLGDESFRTAGETPQSPSSGGLRGDYMSTYEGFVPYTEPHMAILNLLSASSDIARTRDLSRVWDPEEAGLQDAGFLNVLDDTRTLYFNGRDDIEINPGSIRVVDNGTTQYYSFEHSEGDDFVTVRVQDEEGDEVHSFEESLLSETGFVPESAKNSFSFAFDWGKDFSEYLGYSNDFFLSLYYEISGIASDGFTPFAFDSSDDDVMLLSHYLRSEPAVGFLNNTLYLVGLFGIETWKSDHGWVIRSDEDGEYLARSSIDKVDMAYGIGFDWDVLRRVTLSSRYKRYTHEDKNIGFNDYTGNHFKFEIKAFF
ncbi:hypothetical protein [Chitinivibrio alkaliphilus]|uniref:Uncharacterized protein n=1 Tax=Chitinivibrio alkaliphilus ACht1 TaxID=1313304 RepID=U7D894_9BACT|nr:hypothetical protein [Chitinivibrio alkaliphilus]ERP32163.1 hypothetical protein CALK_0892 [Chitinivibrio alkaliphilus ACht1]